MKIITTDYRKEFFDRLIAGQPPVDGLCIPGPDPVIMVDWRAGIHDGDVIGLIEYTERARMSSGQLVTRTTGRVQVAVVLEVMNRRQWEEFDIMLLRVRLIYPETSHD